MLHATLNLSPVFAEFCDGIAVAVFSFANRPEVMMHFGPALCYVPVKAAPGGWAKPDSNIHQFQITTCPF